jgi:enoyl-CoA hydratase/carnithine racemase
VIGSVRGRYFILTRQELGAETAKERGAVNEIVPADRLPARAHEIAEGLAKLPRHGLNDVKIEPFIKLLS